MFLSRFLPLVVLSLALGVSVPVVVLLGGQPLAASWAAASLLLASSWELLPDNWRASEAQRSAPRRRSKHRGQLKPRGANISARSPKEFESYDWKGPEEVMSISHACAGAAQMNLVPQELQKKNWLIVSAAILNIPHIFAPSALARIM